MDCAQHPVLLSVVAQEALTFYEYAASFDLRFNPNEEAMARNRATDPKCEALREQGVLNSRADRVHDPLFLQHDFFDARDLMQVKYELLRRVREEGQSVTEATVAFGVSRPTFYQARQAFEQEGFAGLIPKKRGPRQAHKLKPGVMEFVQAVLSG